MFLFFGCMTNVLFPKASPSLSEGEELQGCTFVIHPLFKLINKTYNTLLMFTYTTKIRVRYAETDQMGCMYHGNYAQFYEVGRVEMMRSLGMSYRGMEEAGVALPVLEFRSKYIRPARYDDEISVKVIMAKLPSTRMHFNYELYNEQGTLINTGETTLVFVDAKTNRPCAPPKNFLDKVSGYFNTDKVD